MSDALLQKINDGVLLVTFNNEKRKTLSTQPPG